MNTYLVIITTVLVLTQIIRVTQNTIQLHRQNVLFREELKTIADTKITAEDFARQREFFRKGVGYLDRMMAEEKSLDIRTE